MLLFLSQQELNCLTQINRDAIRVYLQLNDIKYYIQVKKQVEVFVGWLRYNVYRGQLRVNDRPVRELTGYNIISVWEFGHRVVVLAADGQLLVKPLDNGLWVCIGENSHPVDADGTPMGTTLLLTMEDGTMKTAHLPRELLSYTDVEVWDYSSLYPSIMEAYNLTFTSDQFDWGYYAQKGKILNSRCIAEDLRTQEKQLLARTKRIIEGEPKQKRSARVKHPHIHQSLLKRLVPKITQQPRLPPRCGQVRHR